MDKQINSFNDLPLFLTYAEKDKEYNYYRIIFQVEEGEFVAEYALFHDSLADDDDDNVDIYDYLFKVKGDTFENAACRLAAAFGKEPVKSRVSENEWLLIPTKHGKVKGFDMDEHIRPISVEED